MENVKKTELTEEELKKIQACLDPDHIWD